MPKDINIAGMNPVNYDSDRDPTGMIGISLANQIVEQAGGFDKYFPGLIDKSGEKRQSNGIDYRLFMDLFTDNNWIRIDNPLADTEMKREILRRSGYTHLIVNGGKHVPLDEIRDYQISAVFRKTRRTAARRGF